jgi:hypothetical protein
MVSLLRTRAMTFIRVRKEEGGFFKFGNFSIYFMLFEVWFEAGHAVGTTLAMSFINDVLMILPDFLCESAPSSFKCCCRVRESTILYYKTFSSA